MLEHFFDVLLRRHETLKQCKVHSLGLIDTLNSNKSISANHTVLTTMCYNLCAYQQSPALLLSVHAQHVQLGSGED